MVGILEGIGQVVAGAGAGGAAGWLDKLKEDAITLRDENISRLRIERDKQREVFQTSEREAGEKFRGEESKKAILSREKVAGATATARGKKESAAAILKHKERWFKAYDGELKKLTADNTMPSTPEMEIAARSVADERWGELPAEERPPSAGKAGGLAGLLERFNAIPTEAVPSHGEGSVPTKAVSARGRGILSGDGGPKVEPLANLMDTFGVAPEDRDKVMEKAASDLGSAVSRLIQLPYDKLKDAIGLAVQAIGQRRSAGIGF